MTAVCDSSSGTGGAGIGVTGGSARDGPGATASGALPVGEGGSGEEGDGAGGSGAVTGAAGGKIERCSPASAMNLSRSVRCRLKQTFRPGTPIRSSIGPAASRIVRRTTSAVPSSGLACTSTTFAKSTSRAPVAASLMVMLRAASVPRLRPSTAP